MPEYVYHLTTVPIARIIKVQGMKTAAEILGHLSAFPSGAFVRNRNAKRGEQEILNLSSLLRPMLLEGTSIEQIRQTKGPMLIPHLMVQNNDRDTLVNNLEEWKDKAVESFRKENPKLYSGTLDKKAKVALLRDLSKKGTKEDSAYLSTHETSLPGFSKMQSHAETMLSELPGHFLCQLAVAFTHAKYLIEEAQTATGLYFFEEGAGLPGFELAEPNSVTMYKEYKKHLGDQEIMVLRVDKIKLKNPAQDLGEGKGIRAEGQVVPEHIQYMLNHKDFPTATLRKSDSNWQAIGAWNGQL